MEDERQFLQYLGAQTAVGEEILTRFDASAASEASLTTVDIDVTLWGTRHDSTNYVANIRKKTKNGTSTRAVNAEGRHHLEKKYQNDTTQSTLETHRKSEKKVIKVNYKLVCWLTVALVLIIYTYTRKEPR